MHLEIRSPYVPLLFTTRRRSPLFGDLADAAANLCSLSSVVPILSDPTPAIFDNAPTVSRNQVDKDYCESLRTKISFRPIRFRVPISTDLIHTCTNAYIARITPQLDQA